MKSAIISDKQQEFIEANLDKMNARQLAQSTGLDIRNIYMYLQKKNKKALPIRDKKPAEFGSYERNGFFNVEAYSQFII
jgi:hypothetical protein